MAIITTLPFDSLDEPLRSAKLSLISEIKDVDTVWKSSNDDPIPESFLRACRLYHADHLEMYFSRVPRLSMEQRFSSLISPQNELRVLIYLRKTIAGLSDETLISALNNRLLQLADSYTVYV